MSTIKQVIVLRKDLNMRKGKMVVQGAHASSQICMSLENEYTYGGGADGASKEVVNFILWKNGQQTKICVGVDSEEELLAIFDKAKGLPRVLIRDAGLTEFKEETYTAVAIGPALEEEIDPITGALKLL